MADDWSIEDLEAQLLPEQLRLSLARAACFLAVDTLLAIQLTQVDDIVRDRPDDERANLGPPRPIDAAKLHAMVARLQAEGVLSEADASVIRGLRERASDIMVRLPDVLFEGGLHDLDLLFGAREAFARVGGWVARFSAAGNPDFDGIEFDDEQAQSALAHFAGTLIDAVERT